MKIIMHLYATMGHGWSFAVDGWVNSIMIENINSGFVADHVYILIIG